MKIVADVAFHDDESQPVTAVRWDHACLPLFGDVIIGLDGNEYIANRRRWQLSTTSPGPMAIDRSLEAAQRAAWRDEHPPPPKKVDPINPTLLWDIGTQLERLSWEFRRAANAKRSERAGQIESVVDDIDRLLAPYRQ